MAWATPFAVIVLFMECLYLDGGLKQEEERVEKKLAVSVLYIS